MRILLSVLIPVIFTAKCALSQTAGEIIEKCIVVYGGKEKLDSITSLYMEGTRKIDNAEESIKVTKAANKLSRTDIELEGKKGLILITENEGWKQLPPYDSNIKKLPDDQVNRLQNQLSILPDLLTHKRENTVIYTGKETVNNRACFKIILADTKTGEKEYWIDTLTYLIKKSSAEFDGFAIKGIRKKQPGLPKPLRLYTFYKFYRPVKGVIFPFQTETVNEDDDMIIKIITTYSKIQINITVEDKLFIPG